MSAIVMSSPVFHPNVGRGLLRIDEWTHAYRTLRRQSDHRRDQGGINGEGVKIRERSRDANPGGAQFGRTVPSPDNRMWSTERARPSDRFIVLKSGDGARRSVQAPPGSRGETHSTDVRDAIDASHPWGAVCSHEREPDGERTEATDQHGKRNNEFTGCAERRRDAC